MQDNKLLQLHQRVQQIETFLAQVPELSIGGEGQKSSGSKFDRACLENLSRDMLLSLGREDDDELQERMVMLLQIVAEVKQSETVDVDIQSCS